MLKRVALIIACLACNRTTQHFSGTVSVPPAQPVTPVLQAPALVTQGTAGLTAQITNPVPGLNYNWIVLNAQVTTDNGSNIVFTAGDVGVITFTVAVSNSVGATAQTGTAETQVVTPLPQNYAPQIVTPSQVVSGRGPVPASIANPLADATYTWSADDATLASTAGTSITYTATTAGTLTLTVQATITGAEDAGIANSALVSVVDSDHSLAILAGAPGGVGYLDGPAGDSRLGYQTTTGESDLMTSDTQGNIYFIETGVGALRKITPSGDMSTVFSNVEVAKATAIVAEPNGDFVAIVPSGLALFSNGSMSILAESGVEDFGVTLGETTLDSTSTQMAADAHAANGSVFINGVGAPLIYLQGVGDTLAPSSAVTTYGTISSCGGTSATQFNQLLGMTAAAGTTYFFNDNTSSTTDVRYWNGGGSFSYLSGSSCTTGAFGKLDALASFAVVGATPATGAPFAMNSNGIFYHPAQVDFGFNYAAKLLADPKGGAVLVSDPWDGVIDRITSPGTVPSVSAAFGVPAHAGDQDADDPSASLLTSPRATAVAPDGTIYVYDGSDVSESSPASSASKIRRIDATGVHTLAGSTAGSRDGEAALAEFGMVIAMVATANGLLVYDDVDGAHAVLRTVSFAGDVATVTGGANGDADGAPGVAALGGLIFGSGVPTPTQMAAAADGTVYFADPANNQIRAFSTTGLVSTIAGLGAGPGGQGSANAGPASTFYQPQGIAIGANGSLYVSDTGNSSIRRIDFTADSIAVSTLTGANQTGDGDGPCSQVVFGSLGAPGSIQSLPTAIFCSSTAPRFAG